MSSRLRAVALRALVGQKVGCVIWVRGVLDVSDVDVVADVIACESRTPCSGRVEARQVQIHRHHA